ncbi:MAG: FecR domain-containing protein [Pseudomonadota bacterium]|jgi:transmembrane sensor
MSDPNLGHRTEAVFDAFLGGRRGDLHPADREEAEAFWSWLGDFERPADAPPVARGTGRRWVWAVAATLVLAMTGGTVWMLRPADAFTQHYATGHAERRVVRLADGSTVTLAADTNADVAYTSGERRIRLTRGEALFQVAHNATRPFIVQTQHGEVKAVGTAFDVAVAPREAEVTVVEGVIRIALRGGQQGMRAAEPIEKLARKGERVAFGVAVRDGGSVGFIRQARDLDAESATAWTRGQLVFRGEPLRDVIVKINLYARERVVLTDPQAGSIPVYGVVDQGDTAAIRDLVADPRAIAIEREH